MVAIRSDNKKVEHALDQLVSLLKAGGAYFSEHLIICCENNQLSLRGYDPSRKGEVFCSIPESAFIPTDSVDFKVTQEQNLAVENTQSLTSLQAECLSLIVEIYNLTHKYESYDAYMPYHLFEENPALCEKMLVGLNVNLKDKSFTLDSFLNIRSLWMGVSSEAEKHIVPVLEYLNHHSSARKLSFLSRPELARQRSLGGLASSPPGTDEFFICYGDLDVRQLCFIESYIDRAVTFTRSIPLVFHIPNYGRIEIGSGIKKLPENESLEGIKDILYSFPIFSKRENTLAMNFIYIPQGNAPKVLRRVLGQIFLDDVRDGNYAMKLALFAEHHIITENVNFYKSSIEGLDAMLPTTKVPHVISRYIDMCHLQLDKLSTYPYFDDAIGYEDVISSS